jgi:DNA-binding NarL/FixJ family response regulator
VIDTNGAVGRDEELAAIAAFVDEPDRFPAALLIEGEAGIGKTTLWREGICAAEARSYAVLCARPAEAEADLSYAALADLLGPVVDDALPVLPAPQRHALEVALLRAAADEAADPRTTATALVTVLGSLAEEAPVFVAIDDLQWLDAASMRALDFAIRRLPVMSGLLMTRRTDQPGTAPLELERSFAADRLRQLRLRPLSVAALHQVLRSGLGAAFSRPTLVRLHALSGGNPFYALEIGRGLMRLEREPHAGEPLPIPETLQELVGARVRALSGTAQDVLLAAAAIARPTVTSLEKAFDHRPAVGLALAEAEAAGVLTTDAGRIRFTHPLIASTVYGSAGAARRRRLHRALAGVSPDREERARHLGLSATGPDEVVARALEEAAREAARRGAQDAAAELFGRAGELTPAGQQQDLGRRVLGEATALFALGDTRRAHGLAEQALETTAPPSPLRAQAHLLLGRIAHVDETSRVAAEKLERAVLEAQDDDALRGRIHAELAHIHQFDQPRAIEHAEAAIGLLDRDEDSGPLAYALFAKFFCDVQTGRPPRPQLFEEALELEAAAGTLGVGLTSHPLVWFKSMDDFDAARARYRVEAEWFRERGEEGRLAERRAQLAEVELRAGNWAVAESHIEASCNAIEQIGVGGPWAMALRIRAMIDAHRGRIERARSTLQALIDDVERRGDPFWAALELSTLGFVELTAGDHAAADRALTRMTEQIERMQGVEAIAARSEPDHIEALLALGRPDAARNVLDRLERRGRLLPRLWISATLPRSRALILAEDGDAPAALEVLEEAKQVNELPFELARSLLIEGQIQRRAKHKRAAKEGLAEALTIFKQLGSPDWADRARSELGRIGLRPGPRSELTTTERQVAELAGAGHTNREVAQLLFMSPKTVEANLSRIYRKLEIHSRAELGARMAGRKQAESAEA